MTVRGTIYTVLFLAAVFAGITWWALESSGVAVVTTTDGSGLARETHVWYVEREGQLWLEAGTPDNAWFVDVLSHPEVHFGSPARQGRFRAEPMSGRVARERLRAELSQKYGWRDRWVRLFFDPSRTIAVRLVPID